MDIETFLDRIEEDKAVLMDEEENEVIVPVSWIPNAHEGEAVTLHIEEDAAREKAAREEAKALLKELSGEN
jgi:hypothetical protein